MLLDIYLKDISHIISNMIVFDNCNYDMESTALIEIITESFMIITYSGSDN